ncbi:MAG: cobyric acid synthase [Deltaproteobacteria bacterium]|jgi:adenosylcobyric acid synthase|nr:cobyric acid synthase [Deltaproteobacteria bacterium]
MPAKHRSACLMVQGTTSDAGKSVLVTALCRWLRRRGISVAPFKPQNMALNSALTEDGGEIGRAQAVQALACGLAPHTDMNPVLLKPNSDTGSTVIIQGRPIANMDAKAYHAYKSTARKAVLDSFRRLSAQYRVVVVEGAGSPAEINLRENDIANMGFAESVDCPVILVADIDRGGVFAQLFGTLALLSPSERSRVAGLVINRFRGDKALLEPGLSWLEENTGKPVLGVLPYLRDLHLEAEDSLSQNNRPGKARGFNQSSESGKGHGLKVLVLLTPHASNQTDFDPLRLHPGLNFEFINLAAQLSVNPGTDLINRADLAADLIILGDSADSRRDLDWLRQNGWEVLLKRHLRYGGKLLALRGGGRILDGLGLHPKGLTVMEIPEGSNRQYNQDNQGEALCEPDEQIRGIDQANPFENPESCNAILAWAGLRKAAAVDYPALREAAIERLADMVEEHLDTDCLLKLLEIW